MSAPAIQTRVRQLCGCGWPKLVPLPSVSPLTPAPPALLTPAQVQQSADPDGLRILYYLVQDLKCFVFSLISANFKIQPIQR